VFSNSRDGLKIKIVQGHCFRLFKPLFLTLESIVLAFIVIDLNI
jgi:hypothetical protein